MAITISQNKEKQRYLLLALILIIFVSLLIIWFRFFQKKEEAVLPSLSPAVVYAIPQVKIDWQLLDDLRTRTFKPFEEISAFKGDLGRKNPFISY